MSTGFSYRSLEELLSQARSLGLELPFSANTRLLSEPFRFGKRTVANRLGTAPMEGADSLADGSPSELTRRRYIRAAEGGSGLIWFEAVSIVPEGRSSPGQLLITRENADRFARLNSEIKAAGFRRHGFEPFLVMQANHSGRYSNPEGRPRPLAAYHNPYYEKLRPVDDGDIVSDEYLDALADSFGAAAKLAKDAGFDAFDVKCCHGYLLSELTSAYTRKGRYGGSFENRVRMLRNALNASKTQETDNFSVTARIGLYDGFKRPWGFGAKADDSNSAVPELSAVRHPAELPSPAPDPEEPMRLIKMLHEEFGIRALNLTMGNPYVTTHVTRPFDRGAYTPPEHPLAGLSRMISGTGRVKRAFPELTVLASAPSYLRQYSDLYAAGAVEQGFCDGMLFGRMSFANPGFADQILNEGRLDAKKVCVSCGKCGELIRAHKPAGCVVRDSLFLPYYKEYLAESGKLHEN